MKKVIYTIICFTALVGCRTLDSGVKTNKTVTDTTSTKVTYETKRDTVKVEADSLKFSIPIADLTNQPIVTTSKTGRVTATVRKVNNSVEVECYVDELIKIIESQNKTIETLIKRLETTDTTQTVTEYKTPWYSKILAGIGIIGLFILGIKIGSKYLKPF